MTIYHHHIPKCGGTSIRNFLRERYSRQLFGYRYITAPELQAQERSGTLGDTLRRYECIGGHLGSWLLHYPFISPFTILRDPVELVWSLWRDTVRREENRTGWVHPGHSWNCIEQFLDDPMVRATLTNFQTRYIIQVFDPTAYYLNTDPACPEVELPYDIARLMGHYPVQADLSLAQIILGGFLVVGTVPRLRESLQVVFGDGISIPHDNATKRPDSLGRTAVRKIEAMTQIDYALYEWANQQLDEKRWTRG